MSDAGSGLGRCSAVITGLIRLPTAEACRPATSFGRGFRGCFLLRWLSVVCSGEEAVSSYTPFSSLVGSLRRFKARCLVADRHLQRSERKLTLSGLVFGGVHAFLLIPEKASSQRPGRRSI